MTTNHPQPAKLPLDDNRPPLSGGTLGGPKPPSTTVPLSTVPLKASQPSSHQNSLYKEANVSSTNVSNVPSSTIQTPTGKPTSSTIIAAATKDIITASGNTNSTVTASGPTTSSAPTTMSTRYLLFLSLVPIYFKSNKIFAPIHKSGKISAQCNKSGKISASSKIKILFYVQNVQHANTHIAKSHHKIHRNESAKTNETQPNEAAKIHAIAIGKNQQKGIKNAVIKTVTSEYMAKMNFSTIKLLARERGVVVDIVIDGPESDWQSWRNAILRRQEETKNASGTPFQSKKPNCRRPN